MNLVPLKNLVIDFGILYINKVVSNRKKKKRKAIINKHLWPHSQFRIRESFYSTKTCMYTNGNVVTLQAYTQGICLQSKIAAIVMESKIFWYFFPFLTGPD